MDSNEINRITFRSPAEFRGWLSENVEQTEGIWLRFDKKGADAKSIGYSDAPDEAPCFG